MIIIFPIATYNGSFLETTDPISLLLTDCQMSYFSLSLGAATCQVFIFVYGDDGNYPIANKCRMSYVMHNFASHQKTPDKGSRQDFLGVN